MDNYFVAAVAGVELELLVSFAPPDLSDELLSLLLSELFSDEDEEEELLLLVLLADSRLSVR